MTGAPPTDETLRRVVMLSVHTSPLAQPGTGDAGGLNVYVVESARELARRGTEVEILTRRTAGDQPDRVELTDGVVVRHVDAGPGYARLFRFETPLGLVITVLLGVAVAEQSGLISACLRGACTASVVTHWK